MVLGFEWLTWGEVHAFWMAVGIGLLLALAYTKRLLGIVIALLSFTFGYVLAEFTETPAVGTDWAGFWHPWYILVPVAIVTFLIGERYDNDSGVFLERIRGTE